jgi:hypothetical protein
MARILAYTTPGRGHLFPLIPILGELRRRGRWGGYETSCCGRSCSGRWSARWSRRSTASAAS